MFLISIIRFTFPKNYFPNKSFTPKVTNNQNIILHNSFPEKKNNFFFSRICFFIFYCETYALPNFGYIISTSLCTTQSSDVTFLLISDINHKYSSFFFWMNVLSVLSYKYSQFSIKFLWVSWDFMGAISFYACVILRKKNVVVVMSLT